MKRILIIGSGGAGKSTLAKQLGDRLQIDVVHLDALYWKPGWVETPKLEWQERVESLIQQEAWIIDGNYSSTIDVRLPASDTVIFLDFPRWLCLWRVIKRWWIYRTKTRPDMGSGCPEKLDWQFIQWVWNYSKRSRPAILAKLERVKHEKTVIVLRSPNCLRQFLQELT
jgi:adenylate kinase family enzyme